MGPKQPGPTVYLKDLNKKQSFLDHAAYGMIWSFKLNKANGILNTMGHNLMLLIITQHYSAHITILCHSHKSAKNVSVSPVLRRLGELADDVIEFSDGILLFTELAVFTCVFRL